MAIEQFIKKGDLALNDKDYLSAISAFNSALKENPKAFQALLKRSTAFQRLKNYDSAKKDVSDAYQIADERGKRSDMGLCFYRLGLIYYAEKDIEASLKNFENAKAYDCQEPTLESWLTKVGHEVHKKGVSANQPATTTGAADTQGTNEAAEDGRALEKKLGSTHIDTINKLAPLKIKIRDDWYQSASDVIITIYAKNINKDELKIHFTSSSVSISFPSAANSEYNYNLDPLYGEISSEDSTYKVYSTKLEISLKKKEAIKWPTLEKLNNDEGTATAAAVTVPTAMNSAPAPSSASVYPSSSKKSVNWSNFKVADDEVEDMEKSENDFFAKLYKDTDDDTRRAMMKSYVESNGTVLTTNWSEAKDKKFETSPPEGMVAKSWNKPN